MLISQDCCPRRRREVKRARKDDALVRGKTTTKATRQSSDSSYSPKDHSGSAFGNFENEEKPTTSKDDKKVAERSIQSKYPGHGKTLGGKRARYVKKPIQNLILRQYFVAHKGKMPPPKVRL